MITMDRKYLTADGRDVRILTKDMKNRDGFNVVGIVVRPDGTEFAMQWRDDGSCWDSGTWEKEPHNKQLDLVPVLTKHEAWGVIYDDMTYSFNVFLTREAAEKFFSEDTRARHLVPVTWES